MAQNNDNPRVPDAWDTPDRVSPTTIKTAEDQNPVRGADNQPERSSPEIDTDEQLQGFASEQSQNTPEERGGQSD